MATNARLYSRGEAIDYTPVADTAAGTLVTIGGIIGVPCNDIPAGKLGSIGITGIYVFTKVSGVEFAAGDTVCVNTSTSELATTGKAIGYAVEAAASAADSVKVLLAQGGATITAGE